jgi:hypothetical protein
VEINDYAEGAIRKCHSSEAAVNSALDLPFLYVLFSICLRKFERFISRGQQPHPMILLDELTASLPDGASRLIKQK